MTHTARFCFEYPDERRARVVADSVRVEVGRIDDDRSRAAVERDGRAVSVLIEARDLVALRAGLNTWIRLVETAERVASLAE
ncbi:MAG: KEOPS complex subunit Pcc1 [Salinigranum sp.]